MRDKTVESYFHGTTLKCDKANDTRLCQISDCGICGIVNEGFSSKRIKDDFQRFGKGFYLAPNSSKSNDYCTEPFIGSDGKGTKAQILCDVCPGNKYVLKKTDQSLAGPPEGYNSVFGQVRADLNYPEIVIYESAAIMPRYLILY